MIPAATDIAAVAASLTLFLFVFLWWKSRNEPPAEEQSPSQLSGRGLADVKALTEMVEKHIQSNARRLVDIEDKVKTLHNELTRYLKSAPPLSPPRPPAPPAPQVHSAAAVAPQPAAPVDPIAPDMPRTDDRVTTRLPPAAEPPYAQAAPPAPPSPPPADARASEKSRKWVEQYREMIARPQRREIDGWADDLGGLSVEALEDGSFRNLARDAGGLLLLLPIDGDTALVLPGGRIVVGFGTSYTTCISLRPVTKRAFTLETEADGVFRLIHPALARRDGNTWRLSQAGCISGLTAD